MLKVPNKREELPITAGLSVLSPGNLAPESIELGLWQVDSLPDRIYFYAKEYLGCGWAFCLAWCHGYSYVGAPGQCPVQCLHVTGGAWTKKSSW